MRQYETNTFNRNLDYAIEMSHQWLNKKKSDRYWRVPVTSEHMLSTAASLLVIPTNQKWETIDYLIRNEVWKRNRRATIFLLQSLYELNEVSQARQILTKLPEEQRRILAKFDATNDYYAKLLALLTIIFVPKPFWYSRHKLSYDLFPPFIFSIRNKVGKKLKDRITEILPATINSDGSHSGFTIPTIFCAAFLRETGNNKLFEKALQWISRARNPNGSYKPLIFLDIFETSWACIALADSSVESSIDWMKKHQAHGGFPYYSCSYCPDVDDTSLVTLASVLCNAVDDVTEESVKWLLKAQNPDGGWGTYPKHGRIHATFFRILARVPRFSPVHDLHEHRSASMIDMTARAMITLSYFKEEKRVESAIGKGARFLLERETKRRGFIGFQRWIDSDIYENTLALIALQRSGVAGARIERRFEWLVSQATVFPEEAAHLLWLLHEGNVPKCNVNNIVNQIVSEQRVDGSWEPSLPLISFGEHYFCPVFSTSFNLFCLKNLAHG